MDVSDRISRRIPTLTTLPRGQGMVVEVETVVHPVLLGLGIRLLSDI